MYSLFEIHAAENQIKKVNDRSFEIYRVSQNDISVFAESHNREFCSDLNQVPAILKQKH